MSQRDSGYERKERDLYETPEWVTDVIVDHLPDSILTIWEPACGSGKMSGVLASYSNKVIATDIYSPDEISIDFLTVPEAIDGPHHAIVTNPPYELATEFIERALEFQRPHAGIVAMLLRTDFDHAQSRKHLFANHPAFEKKVVLTKRIKWFEDSKGQPSFNHAWFVWDWKHSGPPMLAYWPA
jgi:hypothetical protein